jgi:hypothetical protein
MATNDTVMIQLTSAADDSGASPKPALSTAEVERLAGEIAAISAHVDAATHRLLTLLRRFDEGSGWYAHGCLSCAQWLSWRIGLDLLRRRRSSSGSVVAIAAPAAA